MLQNDWSYFSTHGRFAYLRKALGEIERTWIAQLERGKEAGVFRADLDARLTYRLLRDVLWIPSQWGATGGYGTEQVADAILRLLFDGILSRRHESAAQNKARAVLADHHRRGVRVPAGNARA